MRFLACTGVHGKRPLLSNGFVQNWNVWTHFSEIPPVKDTMKIRPAVLQLFLRAGGETKGEILVVVPMKCGRLNILSS
jgi:hypothetical protein